MLREQSPVKINLHMIFWHTEDTKIIFVFVFDQLSLILHFRHLIYWLRLSFACICFENFCVIFRNYIRMFRADESGTNWWNL